VKSLLFLIFYFLFVIFYFLLFSIFYNFLFVIFYLLPNDPITGLVPNDKWQIMANDK